MPAKLLDQFGINQQRVSARRSAVGLQKGSVILRHSLLPGLIATAVWIAFGAAVKNASSRSPRN
jgi:hypothetical protein